MEIEVSKKLFSVDEYYHMAEVGILGPDDRVELIDEEIIEMCPIGSRHLGSVNRATEVFNGAFRGRAVVSVQNPLRLTNFTEPQPDIVLLKPRKDHYGAKKPMAEDASLVVEVSNMTFPYDHDVKLKRYARVGIPEVWIENREPCFALTGASFANRVRPRRYLNHAASLFAFGDDSPAGSAARSRSAISGF